MVQIMMQQRTIWILLVGILFSFSSGAGELADDLSQRLSKRISSSAIKKEELGILAFLHQEGQATRLIDLNGQNSMVPASLTKILTAGMSLENILLGTSSLLNFFQLIRQAARPSRVISI